MLTHIVCFKYKRDTPESARTDHRSRIASLKTIDGIIDLRWGADVVGSARSFDTGLIVTFRDRAALDAYQVNPVHVPIAQFGAGLCDQIVAVDFE